MLLTEFTCRTDWRRVVVASLCCLAGLTVNEPAVAQMFGNRQLGRPVSRQARPGSLDEIGSLRNQRFIRGNRSVRNFVGADRSEATNFVGMEQAGAAVQAVRSAVTGLRETVDRSGSVNRPVTPPARDEMYAPRLVVQFDHATPDVAQLREDLSRRLAAMGSPIEVLVAGRTATLRGTVASAGERDLAAVLVSFEPGISAVQNELKVAGDRAVSPLPPPPPAPQGR